MTHRMTVVEWAARTFSVLAMVGIGVIACGGGASPPVAPADKVGAPGGGIGLGSIGGGTDGGAVATKTTNGRLPPEAIQKVVRANFDPMRKCYEDGLRRNRNLQGRVATKFVIDLDGAVTSATDFNSDIPDREVIQCVVDQYRPLHFPKPEGGIVTVVYPIIFNPSD